MPNKKPFTYRKATNKDIPVLVDLRIEFMKDVDRGKMANEKEMRQKLVRYLRRSMPRGEFVAWVCEHDETAIATGAISFYRLPPMLSNISGTCGYILNMFTKKGYRRKGIATVLFSKLLVEGKKRKTGKFILRATDKGRPLYAKFGFTMQKNQMSL